MDKTYDITPEQILDTYFTFKKEDLLTYFAVHGPIVVSADNVLDEFEKIILSIGKKYFIMGADDPLVQTVISLYVKLLAVKDKDKINVIQARPKNRKNDPTRLQ